MSRTIDLNADLGEGAGQDAALMDLVTSCSIACGGHAGDTDTMRRALELARDRGVAAGAHPSFPDRETFGRAPSKLSGPALADALAGQVSALMALADEQGVALKHLKPHGALYNMAARDEGLSATVADVLQDHLPGARLMGPPGSALAREALARGLGFIAEGFADRAYETDGRLRSRTAPGALIADAALQSRQAVDMAVRRRVTAHDGAVLDLEVDTICVHGDSARAVEAARAIRAALENAGVNLCPAG